MSTCGPMFTVSGSRWWCVRDSLCTRPSSAPRALASREVAGGTAPALNDLLGPNMAGEKRCSLVGTRASKAEDSSPAAGAVKGGKGGGGDSSSASPLPGEVGNIQGSGL